MIAGEKEADNILLNLARSKREIQDFDSIWKFMLNLFVDDERTLKEMLLQESQPGFSLLIELKLFKREKYLNSMLNFIEKYFSEEDKRCFER